MNTLSCSNKRTCVSSQIWGVGFAIELGKKCHSGSNRGANGPNTVFVSMGLGTAKSTEQSGAMLTLRHMTFLHSAPVVCLLSAAWLGRRNIDKQEIQKPPKKHPLVLGKISVKLFGKTRGASARGAYPAGGIPTLLDQLQDKEHHEPGPLPPFELRLPGQEPPPPRTFGKGKGARGPGSRGGPGKGIKPHPEPWTFSNLWKRDFWRRTDQKAKLERNSAKILVAGEEFGDPGLLANSLFQLSLQWRVPGGGLVGKGSRLERGSRLLGFSDRGQRGRGDTTSREPSRARTPCLSWLLVSILNESFAVCIKALLSDFALLIIDVNSESILFFSFLLFRHLRDIPAKIPGYPAKKFGFPGFRRTYRTFWPRPFTRKTPTRPGDVRTQKFHGDHHHQDFPRSTAIQMGGVLQYKWEEYWQYFPILRA